MYIITERVCYHTLDNRFPRIELLHIDCSQMVDGTTNSKKVP